MAIQWANHLAKQLQAMEFAAPLTPAGWLFAGLALIDIPIQVRQIFQPQENMEGFEVSALLGKALAVLLVAMNAYDLTSALNHNLLFLWISFTARVVMVFVFILAGGHWRKRATAPGILTGLIFCALCMS
ncbi:hypothetical protein FE257_002681 [Aspergillus nanangensis]|uniref:Uncharacterized protein n=1 Tax=Aspergillus nanangensis TaxID=2582783 RepID=A0AAD4GNX5_ASPNN|nr:hypothetical protein FE257_002681 [Aspergillus nanangensis]